MSVTRKALGTRSRGTRGAHGERPPEFKARAIDLCRSSEGLTIADVARELGIGTKTVRKGVGCRDVSTYPCPVNNESGKRRLATRWADGSTDQSVQRDYWINRHLGSARWRPALVNGNPKRP
jgi:transposase